MKILNDTVTKLAMFTDIHWGAKQNGIVHNEDCLEFIDWFISNIPKDTSHIGFLGDWFEHRNAINIHTLQYAAKGIKKLNDLGLPIIFLTGNHDLYRRHTREVTSLDIFTECKNVHLVTQPTRITGTNTNILCLPYIFAKEYETLLPEINKSDVVLGHLEFKGFVLTGYNTVMEHGPDHKLFSGPKKIFTGHFHKRQSMNNVHYIGNTFPTNFGDAGDYERGMSIYNLADDKLEFINWVNNPKYYRTKLSKVLTDEWKPLPKMIVKCTIDENLGYQEAQDLREGMISLYKLRDFILEEDREAKQGLLEGENFIIDEEILEFTSIDDLVVKQLESIKEDKSSKMDVELLIDIYKNIPVEAQPNG